MKFGLFMMPLHHPTENPTLAFQRDLQLIEYVEDLGFEEIWVGEHHTGGWETIPSPDIFISAAAQRTKRIRIGTGVVSLPFQHPFVVAERMAFLDHLTYGRIMLGVGPGVLPSDAKLFGLEAAQLRPMLNEALEIILKLYQEPGPVTYEGEYWTLREMALQLRPYQKPHLPLAVASAGGSNSLELAGKYGLLILSALFSVGQTSQGLAQAWEKVEESARANGRTARREDWRVASYVYVGDTTQGALEDVRRGSSREEEEYLAHTGYPWPGRIWMVGDPDHVARQIKSLEEEIGGFGGLLLVSPEWTSTEKWNHSLDLFARYVMPQFQGSLVPVRGAYERMVHDNKAGLLGNPASQPVSSPSQKTFID